MKDYTNNQLADRKMYLLTSENATKAEKAVGERLQREGVTDQKEINLIIGEETAKVASKYIDGNYCHEQEKARRKQVFTIPKGGNLPDDLSGINEINGDTYANKEKIKEAGFKWDGKKKSWIRLSKK